jgi:hypothetical protein
MVPPKLEMVVAIARREERGRDGTSMENGRDSELNSNFLKRQCTLWALRRARINYFARGVGDGRDL